MQLPDYRLYWLSPLDSSHVAQWQTVNEILKLVYICFKQTISFKMGMRHVCRPSVYTVGLHVDCIQLSSYNLIIRLWILQYRQGVLQSTPHTPLPGFAARLESHTPVLRRRVGSTIALQTTCVITSLTPTCYWWHFLSVEGLAFIYELTGTYLSIQS